MGFELQPPVIWLIVFGIMVVIELLTMGLTTIWFAGGALAAMLVSLTKAGPLVQIILFIAVSVILLCMIRPYARRHFNHGREKTNAQSLIGQNAIVIESIDNMKSQGRVMVRGQEWSARSVDESHPIAKDAKVCIKDISGVKLMVEEI